MTTPITVQQTDFFTPEATITRKYKMRGYRTEITHPFGDLASSYIMIRGEEAEFVNGVYTGKSKPDGRNVVVNGVEAATRAYNVYDWSIGQTRVVTGIDVILFLAALDADERGKLLDREQRSSSSASISSTSLVSGSSGSQSSGSSQSHVSSASSMSSTLP